MSIEQNPPTHHREEARSHAVYACLCMCCYCCCRVDWALLLGLARQREREKQTRRKMTVFFVGRRFFAVVYEHQSCGHMNLTAEGCSVFTHDFVYFKVHEYDIIRKFTGHLTTALVRPVWCLGCLLMIILAPGTRHCCAGVYRTIQVDL